MRWFPALLLFVATTASAAEVGIDSRLPPFELPDQFGRNHVIKEMPKVLILTFEKSTGAMVNQYLTRQEENYLPSQNALFIADIARMPTPITLLFALPKMRRYEHTILLAYDRAFQESFPRKKGHATIIHFGQTQAIEAITFVQDDRELEGELSRSSQRGHSSETGAPATQFGSR